MNELKTDPLLIFGQHHEKKVKTFNYSSIEWRAHNYIDLVKDKNDQLLEIINALNELDDVQNIFTNANLKNLQ